MAAKPRWHLLIFALIAVLAITWGVWHGGRPSDPVATPFKPISSTTSTSSVSVAAPTQTIPPNDFMGIVRDASPEFPATEPLAIPAELHEGARLLLREPIYLDSTGALWITRDDAPAAAKVLKTAADDQIHLIRERVYFVHYFLDDSQQWQPQIVCKDTAGNFVLISADARLNLGKRFTYHWDRAFDWNSTTNEGFVVPTDTGVSVFRPRSLPVELHHDFVHDWASATAAPASTPNPSPVADTLAFSEPQQLLDMRGLLAWMPWDATDTGSRGAARFVDGQWHPLGPDQGWPEKLLHLIPLIGGGVDQLIYNEDGTVSESLGQLDAAAVDEKVVDPLIQQLSDVDPKVRDTASEELTRYGPGLWPILEKSIDDQPPEGQMRIHQLLESKQSPTLGRMTLLPGKVQVLAHLQDGGALLHADAGVSIPNHDPARPPIVTAPAYINIRPDRPIDFAPPALVKDLSPDARFDVAPDEWIVTDDVHGPRRLLGNHLEPILRKSEIHYSQFVGIDRKGRWLFREPNHETPTLVLDPNLPDATPRLAAWIQPVNCDIVGWDEAGWPVVMKNDSAWALHAEEWAPLPSGPARKFYKSLDEMPPTTGLSTTRLDTTNLATSSSQPTTDRSPIFTDSDGTTYFDGQLALIAHHADGSIINWPLPPAAVGTGEVYLVQAPGDQLFLFNQSGRVLRIKPMPHGSEPFKLEATFTRQIPNADHYSRVWLDPAGRIDLEYDTNHLTILFPDGRIPRAIAEKMPAEQTKDDGE